MSLQDRIQEDLKTALVNKDELPRSVLRMLNSALHNEAIALKKKELSDDEIISVISTEAKKRKDAAAAFTKGGRSELANQEQKELAILEKYLPEQVTEEEIKKIVQEVIEQLTPEKRQMGLVMKTVMPKLKGQADGKIVSRIVKESLDSI